MLAINQKNPHLRPDVLHEMRRSVTHHCKRYVWLVEQDVALVGEEWGHFFRRWNEREPDVEYVASGTSEPLSTEHLGNMHHFIREEQWRRELPFISRLSPRPVLAMLEYINAGLVAYMEQVIPSICNAIGCSEASLKQHQQTFPDVWTWATQCRALAVATEHFLAGSASPHRGQLVHPFKWDTVLDFTSYRKYAGNNVAGSNRDGSGMASFQQDDFIPQIRGWLWTQDLPQLHDRAKWSQQPMAVQERCGPMLAEDDIDHLARRVQASMGPPHHGGRGQPYMYRQDQRTLRGHPQTMG